MDLGTLGPSSRENPTYPNIKLRISMGFQVTRVVCTFPMKNMITSWLRVEVQIFDFFLRVFLDKLGANKVNINWNTPPTEVCIHNNAEPPKKIEN